MAVTNYLPFRCIIFINESTLIVGVCKSKSKNFLWKINSYLKGHEFSPLIYKYDQRKGTIEFVEKLDRQEVTSGRQSIGWEFLFDFSYFY